MPNSDAQTHATAKWRARNPERNREIRRLQQVRYRKQTRQTVIEMYGGCCVCCGETESVFLAIDHVNGGGKAHKATFNSQLAYYCWLKEKKREGFQVLCLNCNSAKAILGYCPHGNGI